jgi:hypothetical protein
MNAVKTITRRQLSREPASLNAIQPGETITVPDAHGGLLVTRPKRHRLTPAEMLAQLDAVPGQWIAVDTRAFLGEGE